MSLPSPLIGMADHQFVSLTTFRKDGTPVSAPVWIARDGDALVVTTEVDTGKVKRLRRDPRVELRPCSRFGKVPENAEVAAGVADIVAPDDRSVGALKAKYGLQYRVITTVERLMRRGRRGERVILRITPG